jgi:hypothetical protein
VANFQSVIRCINFLVEQHIETQEQDEVVAIFRRSLCAVGHTARPNSFNFILISGDCGLKISEVALR